MKILNVLLVLLIFASTKIKAQSFLPIEDSIIVDSYVNRIDPNHQMPVIKYPERIIHVTDKMGRIKSDFFIDDSLIIQQDYSYSGDRNMLLPPIYFKLASDCHWYIVCIQLDIPYYVKRLGLSIGN